MICKGTVFERVWYVWATFLWMTVFAYSWLCEALYIHYWGNNSVNLKTHNTGEEVPQDWRTGVLKTPNDCRWNAKILVWLLHSYQQHFRFLSEGWCDHMKTHFEKMTGDIKQENPKLMTWANLGQHGSPPRIISCVRYPVKKRWLCKAVFKTERRKRTFVTVH